MAEAAGLVLGAIPLIFLALDKYQECLEFGRNYVKYEEALAELRDGVSLQQLLFDGTMEMIGLYRPTYVELEECLRVRFPGKQMLLIGHIKRMEATINQLMANLRVEAKGKQSDNISSRVGWEWRRVKTSLSANKRKDMFENLHRSNELLRSLLLKPEIPLEDRSPVVQRFVARYNQNDCDAVRFQAVDVKKALDACWQCSCSHRTSLDLDWSINRPKSSPVFSVSLSYKKRGNQGSTESRQWRKAHVQVDTSDTSSSSSSTGDDKRVMGPSRTDLRLTAAHPETTGLQQRSRSRAPFSQLWPRSHSTSPLPPSPRKMVAATSSVDCARKIDSLCQFVRRLDNGGEPLGVLSVPEVANRVRLTSIPGTYTEQATLVHLLPPQKLPKHLIHLVLTRLERLEIAAAAAWTTLLLCDTPWFEHTLNKHKLCFFSQDIPLAGIPATSRCISLTQGCTLDPRTTDNDTISHNKLVRNGAIFALGVLLIELCLNRSFEECKRAANIDTTVTTVIDDYNVADNLIDEVFREGGASYGNAVRRCIRFAFPGRDVTKTFSHATFRQDFHKLVVAPVEAVLSITQMTDSFGSESS